MDLLDASQDRRPIPDPTLLTTQQLLREIGALKEVIFTRLEGDAKHFEQAISAVKAGLRAQKEAVAFKCAAMDRAVAGAFASAKEARLKQHEASELAIQKSDASTTKEIDGLHTLIANISKSSDEKIGDLKERLTRIEGESKGRSNQTSMVLSVLALIISFTGVATGLILALAHK